MFSNNDTLDQRRNEKAQRSMRQQSNGRGVRIDPLSNSVVSVVTSPLKVIFSLFSSAVGRVFCLRNRYENFNRLSRDESAETYLLAIALEVSPNFAGQMSCNGHQGQKS